MPPAPPPPPVPPPQPQPISNLTHLNKSKAALPDFFLAALSLFAFLSSSSSSSKSFKFPAFSIQLNPRRFFKIPSISMEFPNSNSKSLTFTSPQSLSEWLQPRLPSHSFASWGVIPGTKNLHNLWLEISQGETSLADSNPPIRTLHVLSLRIIDNHHRLLLESHQQLSDGTLRNRNRPLSEKMKPNETPESAVYRAVQEELGSILGDSDYSQLVRIVPDSYRLKIEERDSVSYPGLSASYVLHSMDVWVEGLPDGDFCTVEEEEYVNSEDTNIADHAVSVKKHFWKWDVAELAEYLAEEKRV
ncbi:uncharacterized protein LOC101208896 isoform X2 [Cucumis sativus]|uniref:uncharacterized protein LOC101208896 isoform X2 n=1 Tax=Cucumis sativus TaxID=3659 RepID=UPI0012F4E456|nr:uncharacterized protein LOC101208896 isoform X2 [Cucumis sativus]